tara:strand:+ start:9244 stop:9840 length:597 start_codon:yes stop_codon:yes gene_type:complete
VFATGLALSLKPRVEVGGEGFDYSYRFGVRGAFNVIKHGALALKDAGGGSIVMILTTAVLRTLEHDGMSGGPKTAVAALSKQVARETGPYNVRCNGLALAVIDAALIYPYKLVNDPYAQGVINAMVSNTPSGRTERAVRSQRGRGFSRVARCGVYKRADYRGGWRVQRVSCAGDTASYEMITVMSGSTRSCAPISSWP